MEIGFGSAPVSVRVQDEDGEAREGLHSNLSPRAECDRRSRHPADRACVAVGRYPRQFPLPSDGENVE